VETFEMAENATNYLVAVLPNRMEAESAYLSLKDAKLPMESLDILGRGFRSADDFGLINPNKAAQKHSEQLANGLVPFGFVAGFVFNVLTGIELISWIGPLGNHLLGGVFAAAAAALGALMTGALTGWTTGSGDAIAYRNRLNAGKYLIIARGTETLMREVTRLLRQHNLENIQGYIEFAEG
jgi:hypothetical protein